MDQLLAQRLDGDVLVLELNDPPTRNAVTSGMRVALVTALAEAEANTDVNSVVLTGRGRNFSSGGDLRTMGSDDPEQNRARMMDVTATAMAVARFPKPLVVAVRGYCVGAGVGIALLSDAVVTGASAKFSFSFRNLALGPDWGLSWTLPTRIGRTRARAALLRGETFPAEQALQLGLSDAQWSDEALPDEAISYARYLGRPPLTTEHSIKLQMSDLSALEAALHREASLQVDRLLSPAHKSALTQVKNG